MSCSEIIAITPDNIFDMGVLCGGEVRFSEGKRKKTAWYRQRYEEGLRIKISVNAEGKKTGMIEYVPGEFAWRTIKAEGYMVIHCLQVLRSHTHKGYGKLLLNECINDSGNTNGIAVVTSSKPWVNDKRYFLKNGFKKIAKAPPYFELLVRQFKEAPLPCFITGWEDRALQYGDGVTVLYSDQCPIFDYGVKNIQAASRECNMEIKLCKIDNCVDAQNAPSPYGAFGVIKDGKFITHRIFDKEKYIHILKNGAIQ